MPYGPDDSDSPDPIAPDNASASEDDIDLANTIRFGQAAQPRDNPPAAPGEPIEPGPEYSRIIRVHDVDPVARVGTRQESDDLDTAPTIRSFVRGTLCFGRYRLKRVLGRGGMGVVWLAQDTVMDQPTALKFLPEMIIHDKGVLDDLKRETRRGLDLTHRNIVKVFDFLYDDTAACIRMEFVDGDTLTGMRVDKPSKIFEAAELADWVRELCDALELRSFHR